jgi:GMP synthase (glutamine-hydrolysing)
MSTILVIEHVPHERLGTFEEAFTAEGCTLRPLRVYEPRIDWDTALAGIGGVVSMGGPMSAYHGARHPWIARERALLREAVERGVPALGVCLGAQMLAAALGATVKPMPQPAPAGARGGPGKEIGWYPLMREPGAEDDPLFTPFGQTETVFQWHGDAFGLPKGAVRLFSSPLCQEQAFRYGRSVYGLQFHLEVTEAMIRAWMQKNRAELSTTKGIIDPMAIRRQSPQHAGRLKELSTHVARTFARLVTSSQPRRPANARSSTR